MSSYTKAKYLESKGVTQESLKEMLQQQNGRCPICNRSISLDVGVQTNRAALDHSHRTKKNRSLLCYHCNRALGLFADNIDTLVSAVIYLTEWNRKHTEELGHTVQSERVRRRGRAIESGRVVRRSVKELQ